MARPITPETNAGMVRRLITLVYDTLLLLGVLFVYAIPVVILRHLFEEDPMQRPPLLSQILILLGMWVVCSAYFAWCWHKGGQTLAMKSWRMRLESISGETLSWKQCWLRCVVAPLCIAAGGIGLLWVLFHPRNMALQDILTGTRVRLLPKEKKKGKGATAPFPSPGTAQ